MEVTTVVLQAGAAVDHQDEEDRDTPAHAASRCGVVTFLPPPNLSLFHPQSWLQPEPGAVVP